MKHFRMALVFLFVATPFCGNCLPDSLSIFYATGVTDLSTLQKARIDSFLYSGSLDGKETIGITAYADEPGTTVGNKRIAQQRAVSVRQYLKSSGIAEKHIAICKGAGNVLQSGDDLHQRRADLFWISAGAAVATQELAEQDTGVAALGRMKPDDIVELKSLLFRVSSDVILKPSLPLLNQLVAVMTAYPALVIRLEGHICCGKPGSASKSDSWFLLSEERAKAVMDYLIKHGISEARLSYKGLGFSRPKVYPERTAEDQHQNRRVEVRVISNKQVTGKNRS